MIQSVTRALQALDLVQEASIKGTGITLSEISEKLEIQNTTARNILKTMLRSGYLSQNDSRQYVLGSKSLIMKKLIMGNEGLAEKLFPLIQRLGKKMDETFLLTSLVNGKRKVLFRVKSGNPVAVDIDTAESIEPYSLATNLLMLSFCDSEQRKKFIHQHPDFGEYKDEQNLMKKLAELKNNGFVKLENKDIVSAAFPVLDKYENFLCAVGFYAPRYRCDGSKYRKMKIETEKTIEIINSEMELA